MRLFVHIPKNGGMTIRKAKQLRGEILVANHGNHVSPEYTAQLHAVMAAAGEHHGDEHARWRDWRADLREQYQAFAIVRNPWSRCVSRYTFANRAADRGRFNRPANWTFQRFLEERHEYGGREFFWHRGIHGWFQQKDYVTDEAGSLRCDVLRFEHYWPDVCGYLNLPGKLEPRNVSNGEKAPHDVVNQRDYREFYEPEDHDVVAQWYAEDIKFFGFTFDGPATRNVWACGRS